MQGFTLARKVDVRYRTNLLLVIITALIIAFAWLLTGSAAKGAGLGGGFFFCWALARETDPAHDISAFVAGGIYLLASSVYDGIDLGILFWLLLLLRLISGICGKTPTNLDVLSTLGLTVYLVYSRQTSIYLFLATLALIFAWYRYGKDRRFSTAAILAAILSLCGIFLWRPIPGTLFMLNTPLAILTVFSLIILGATHSMELKKDLNIEDDQRAPLKTRWIRLSQLFYITALLVLLMLEKLTKTTSLLLFAVMAGILLFRVFMELRGKITGTIEQ